MTSPAIKVELAFGSTWQTEPASRSWTDVTQYVLQDGKIATSRGASSARGQVDVGSCSLAFKNADRRFDPTHASGAYYGDLLPGVPIRITATPAGGASKAVWLGTVAKWPQRYDLGNTFSWVPVEAYDGFDKLSRAKIPRSYLQAQIAALGPAHHWPLDSSELTDLTATSAAGSFSPLAGKLVGQWEIEGGGSYEAVDFDAETKGTVRDTAAVISAMPFTIFVAFEPRMPAAEALYSSLFRSSNGNSRPRSSDTAVFFNPSGVAGTPGYVDFGSELKSTTGELRQTPAIFDLNAPNAVSCVASTTRYEIRTQGATYTTVGANLTDRLVTTTGVHLGGLVKNSATQRLFEGPIAHAAWFASALADADMDALEAAFLTPLDNQTTDQRIGYVLDEIDWPTNLRDLETGNTTLGPATFKPGDLALGYLRLITSTEDGLLFLTADGKVRFLDRYWRYLDTLATVSQFTFTDAAGSSTGYAEFDLDLDDELLVNVARFTRRDGAEQVASNATSVGIYGEAEKQQSNLLHRTDTEARALAEWTVATQGTPLPRVPKIRVPLHAYSAADQAAVLALDLGHRVTCVRTPQGVGSSITLAFQIDGIRNDIGGGEWWWEAYVSPVPEDTATLFILDTSELDGPDILAY